MDMLYQLRYSKCVEKNAVSVVIQFNVLIYNKMCVGVYRFWRFEWESVSILKPIQNRV